MQQDEIERRMDVFGDIRHDLAQRFRYDGERKPFIFPGVQQVEIRQEQKRLQWQRPDQRISLHVKTHLIGNTEAAPGLLAGCEVMRRSFEISSPTELIETEAFLKTSKKMAL